MRYCILPAIRKLLSQLETKYCHGDYPGFSEARIEVERAVWHATIETKLAFDVLRDDRKLPKVVWKLEIDSDLPSVSW